MQSPCEFLYEDYKYAKRLMMRAHRFFQSHGVMPPLALDMRFMNHTVLNFEALSTQRPELQTSIDSVMDTMSRLLPKVRFQNTLNDMANALALVTQYTKGHISKEALHHQLQNEHNIAVQQNKQLSLISYGASMVLVTAAVLLGCALPYVVLVTLIAAGLAYLTYRHEHDPRRILGEQLLSGAFEPLDPNQNNNPDALSASYGL